MTKQAPSCFTVKKVMINYRQIPCTAVIWPSLSYTHTCTRSRYFTLRRGKRKPLSKLWCGTGDWGKFKGHVVEETNRGNEREMGRGMWHRKTLTRLLQGIARRLLIRTPVNEVQGHSIHKGSQDSPLTADILILPSQDGRRVLHDLMKNRSWTWSKGG